MHANDQSPCGDLVPIPTPEQRAANHRALSKLHAGNRFRLMFGMPLLPQHGLRRHCLQCNREYDSTLCQCPDCQCQMFCDLNVPALAASPAENSTEAKDSQNGH